MKCLCLVPGAFPAGGTSREQTPGYSHGTADTTTASRRDDVPAGSSPATSLPAGDRAAVSRERHQTRFVPQLASLHAMS